MTLLCLECGSTEFDKGEPAGFGSSMNCPVKCVRCGNSGEIRSAHDGTWTEYPDGITNAEKHVVQKYRDFIDAVETVADKVDDESAKEAVEAANRDSPFVPFGGLRLEIVDDAIGATHVVTGEKPDWYKRLEAENAKDETEVAGGR